jgi:integrase
MAACSAIAATGHRNRALLALLYCGGLRVSEVLAVRPADLDMRRHAVQLQDTKSGRAQTRGWHPSVDDTLARWLDTRRARGIGGRARLFCTLAGEDLYDDYVRGRLRRLDAAVELEAAGTPVTTISKLLGHSSVSVTARYLDHLTNGQAVAALADADLAPMDAVR